MDPHLEGVPSLRTLTARGLSGGNLQDLGGEADGALDAQVLALRAVDQLSADLLEGLHLAGGEGDTDLVDLGGVAGLALLGVLEGHGCGFWCREVGGWKVVWKAEVPIKTRIW